MASIRRQSPSGERGPPFPTCRQDRGSPDRLSSQQKKRPSSLHSEGILCCRSTTACTLSAHPPASDPIVPSPVSATPRDLPAAAGRRRSLGQTQIQGLSDRLFSYRHAEVRTAQGKLYLLVAIDRTSKFAFVEMHEKVTRRTAADFLRRLIAAVPYKVHTVLTDNGTHFTTPGNT